MFRSTPLILIVNNILFPIILVALRLLNLQSQYFNNWYSKPLIIPATLTTKWSYQIIKLTAQFMLITGLLVTSKILLMQFFLQVKPIVVKLII